MRCTSVGAWRSSIAVLAAGAAMLLSHLQLGDCALYQGKPPRGWNSYDGFTCTVTEEEVRANAEVMATHLASYGYEYVVIDYEWFRPGTGQFSCCGRNPWQDLVVDSYGRLLPSPDRYPSAKESSSGGMPGFKPLADYMHGLKLKFGIHIMRGIPRVAVEKDLPIFGSTFTAKDAADNSTYCSWCDDMSGVADNAAGQAYYDSLIKLYAQWGVDFIKMDCAYHKNYMSEIMQISRAIEAQDREIVLSMSPTDQDPVFAKTVGSHVTMYRINGDVWDNWQNVESAFRAGAAFPELIGRPSYPDLDMLPIGHLSVRGGHGANRTTALTADEQHTMMNLWAVFRSPLMMGGDMRSLPNDNLTLSLLTNEELLSIQADSSDNMPVKASAYYATAEAAIEELISVKACKLNDRSQQWGSVTTSGDGSLPNHATGGCLSIINCSQAANATLDGERCHVGSGCLDGTNQVWEVTRDGYIDTPMNQACLTSTAATLPCNVTAMAKSTNLTQLQKWKRNETDNTLHHVASGGCLTSTLVERQQTTLKELYDANVAAWVAHSTTNNQLHYMALFNLDSSTTLTVSAPFAALSIKATSCDLTNIWTGVTAAGEASASASLAPHASVLYRVDASKCKA